MASRVLSKYGSYSEATKVKVEAAARLLNYTANGIARSLRLKTTHTIGVMISEIISYHWTVFVQGVEEAARRAGYHVILCNTADDPKRELEYLAEMRERGVDGLIVSPMAVNFPHFSKLAKSGFPIVAMNARVPGDGITRILSDDKQAAAEAVVARATILAATEPKLAQIALGLAWLLASGRRTRMQIEAAAGAHAAFADLRSRLGNESGLREYVDQGSALY